MKIIQKLNENFKNGAVTIAFLGDSVTHGFFESGGVMHSSCDFQAVYHNRFKQMLNLLFPTMPINIINAGIGGDSANVGAERLERDVISKSPDLAVVCFGLNDINSTLESYIYSLNKIFNRLKENKIETIFMTPNMLNTYISPDCVSDLREYAQKTAEIQTGGKMDSFMDAAVRCAKTHNIPVADCYSKWKELYNCGIDTTQLLANRINHPKRDMHELFAYELLQTILK